MIGFGNGVLPILEAEETAIILRLHNVAFFIFAGLDLLQLSGIEVPQLHVNIQQAAAIIDVEEIQPFRNFHLGGGKPIGVNGYADDLDRRGRRLHCNGDDRCHDWFGGSSALRSPSQACEGDEECETECNQSPQSETTE